MPAAPREARGCWPCSPMGPPHDPPESPRGSATGSGEAEEGTSVFSLFRDLLSRGGFALGLGVRGVQAVLGGVGVVLGEQLCGEGDFHPGVWVRTRREEWRRGFWWWCSSSSSSCRVWCWGPLGRGCWAGRGRWFWGWWGTLGMCPWVNPPCLRSLPPGFSHPGAVLEVGAPGSLPAGAPGIATTNWG